MQAFNAQTNFNQMKWGLEFTMSDTVNRDAYVRIITTMDSNHKEV
jgi:hypothetical protein